MTRSTRSGEELLAELVHALEELPGHVLAPVTERFVARGLVRAQERPCGRAEASGR